MGSLAVLAGPVDYLTQIRPILAAKCYACHGALKQEAEFRLDTRALMLSGNNQVVVPGDSHGSVLLQRVSGKGDERMPPEGEGSPLTADEIEIVRQWIDQGAPAPDEPTPPDPREHWAFQCPQRPTVPPSAMGSANPIDAFIAEGYRKHNLKPVGLAEKRVLLRRLYLDLIGLPPTPNQLADFLADESVNAYENVVEHLLSSPAYGERWGRHWMDVWRYTDWYGLGSQVRYSQKHIWRWRDWILQSLNEDKPYSEMIVEMLAGDEIAPTDPNVVRATGFLARNYFIFNRTTWLDTTVEHTSKAFLGLTLNCAKCHNHKYDPLSQVDYYRMRAVFEPHQVRLDPIPGETDLDADGLPRAFDNDLDTPTYIFARGDEKSPDTARPIRPGTPSVLSRYEFLPAPIDLPAEAYSPELQEFALNDHLAKSQRQIESSRQTLRAAEEQLAQLQQPPPALAASPAQDGAKTELAAAAISASGSESANAAEPPSKKTPTISEARAAVTIAEKNLAVAELHPNVLRSSYSADVAKARKIATDELGQLIRSAATAARTYELAQADAALAQTEQQLATSDEANAKMAMEAVTAARTKRDEAKTAVGMPGETYPSLYVTRRAANGMVDEETPRHGPYSKTSSGRRTALAQWIASRDNPLTARVAVNHIWMRHFGQPLVESVDDFGLRAPRPPQQTLLDWLSVEFMNNNWSMKHLHRLIVCSQTYRLNSSLLGADPVTRRIDPENQYYWHHRSTRMESQVVRDSMLLLAGILDLRQGGPNLQTSLENELFRRTLYFTHASDDRGKFTAMFDDADILACYRRRESIIPQQALALANSKLAMSMSEKIANEIQKRLGDMDDDAFITAAFETILLLEPTPDERNVCRKMLQDTTTLLQNEGSPPSRERTRQNLVHALLNHNDFITVR